MDAVLLDRLAADMEKAKALAPDEVTSKALSERTGKTVGECYKFLMKLVHAGKMTKYRMAGSVRVFREVKP